MKTEDIDKKIGMPDVNEEWAKFEREVINKKAKFNRRTLYAWIGGMSIAASLLLFFVLSMKDELAEEPQLTAQTMIEERTIDATEVEAEEADIEVAAQPEVLIAEVKRTSKAHQKQDIKPDAAPIIMSRVMQPADTIKTLPARLIAQVRAYEQKSDPNRTTGFDDGSDDVPHTFDMKEYEGLSTTKVDDALQGRIAGLEIVENAGQLGADNHTRHGGINAKEDDNKDRAPLIVVDGTVLDNKIPTSNAKSTSDIISYLFGSLRTDITDIKVLKDSAATAAYGDKGKYGVLAITTKSKIKFLPDSIVAKIKKYEKKSDPNILTGSDTTRRDTVIILKDVKIKRKNDKDSVNGWKAIPLKKKKNDDD